MMFEGAKIIFYFVFVAAPMRAQFNFSSRGGDVGGGLPDYEIFRTTKGSPGVLAGLLQPTKLNLTISISIKVIPSLSVSALANYSSLFVSKMRY